MFLVNGMIFESMLAALILSRWSVPQGDVGEDLRDAAETWTLGVRLRSDQVAPPKPGLRQPSVLEYWLERRVLPCVRDVMTVKKKLASTLQLSLHDRNQEPNGLRALDVAVTVIDEQAHGKEVWFLRVDAFDLSTHVAPHHHVPTKELNAISAVPGLVRHAYYFMGVVTDDPQRLLMRALNVGER